MKSRPAPMTGSRRARYSVGIALSTALLGGCGPELGATPDAGEVRPARVETAPPGSTPVTAASAPKRIFAKRFVVNVRTGPDGEAPRIGYLRGGAVLQARSAEPLVGAGCRGGWYELTTGGFVCNGRDVV